MSNAEEVRTLVEILAARGMDVGLDSMASGLRITNASGSRDISPRLAPREMVNWLNGFVNGIEEFERQRRVDARERMPVAPARGDAGKEPEHV